jgi:FHA domain-containing protein
VADATTGQTRVLGDRASGDTRTTLVVSAPAHVAGRTIRLDAARATIGREGNHALDVDGLSRQHARVWLAEGSAWIEDCASTNGTLVNGVRITGPAALRPGDLLVMGALTARVASPVEHRDDVVHATASVSGATETTRYLCAAVHLDDRFARRVVDELLHERFRALAPAYGVDLAAVAAHAVSARRRRLRRDAALLAVLLLSAGGAAVVAAGGNAAGAAPWVVIGLLVAWAITTVEIFVMRHRALRRLSVGRSDGVADRPRMSATLQEQFDNLVAAQAGNVVVFRDFNPFVGSGFFVADWSFAIDVTKGVVDPRTGDRRTPVPFDAGDLHLALLGQMRMLGLPGLTAQTRLFVHGGDVQADKLLLPDQFDRPATSIDESVLIRRTAQHSAAGRTYLAIEATGWRGHLVVTMFVRTVRLRDSLFVEWSAYALRPLRDEYYAVDRMRQTGPAGTFLASASHAFPRFIVTLAASPVRVVRALSSAQDVRRQAREDRRVISGGWAFNYGADTSIREEATGTEHNRYFLALDEQMFVKVVQRRLLAAIGDFLTENGIDTREFSQQQTVINQNSTVTVRGVTGPVQVAGRDMQGSGSQVATSSTPAPSGA